MNVSQVSPETLRRFLLELPWGDKLVALLRGVWHNFLALTTEERIFAVVTVAILLLTLVSILFAQRALVLHLKRRRGIARANRLKEEWTQTLLDALAGDTDMASIWRKVRRRDRYYFIDFLAVLARRLTGEERELLEDAARPWLRIMRKRVRSREPERRARALRTLADLSLQRNQELFVQALDDPSELVSMVAARNLIRVGSGRHVVTILDRLDRYSVWSERYLSSMIASAGSAAAPLLREYLRSSDVSDRTSAVLLRALTAIGDADAAPLAGRILLDTESLPVRLAALDLLGRLGTPAQAPMVRRFAEEGDETTMTHAIQTLGHIGEEQDVPAILKGLDFPSPWVALRSAQALMDLGEMDPLLEFARSGHPNGIYARQVLAGEGA